MAGNDDFMEKQIVVYKGAGNVCLEVKTDGETVWLTQAQMCQLFGRDRTVITKHINNIFKEGELERELDEKQEFYLKGGSACLVN